MTNSNKNERLNEIESTLMHLQNDYESLNEVVLENSKQLTQLANLMQRIVAKLDAPKDDEPPRSLEDEKPPHY